MRQNQLIVDLNHYYIKTLSKTGSNFSKPNKGPIETVKNNESQWEQYSAPTIYPVGNLLRSHCEEALVRW